MANNPPLALLPPADRIELDVFEMIANTAESVKFGLKFNLAPAIRCKSVQEVNNLPFIYHHFKEGKNEIYFRWYESISLYAIFIDKKANGDIIIIGFARFAETNDSRAVDLVMTR